MNVDGVTANIMLSNVNIKFQIGDSADNNKCAFELTGGAYVTLTLQEGTTNILKSGRNKAGLGVPDGQSLKIQGTGALEAIGCINGAGIGSDYKRAGGTIRILSGRADRFIFDREPALDNALVYIHIISSIPAYDKTYDFGVIGS